MPPQRIILTLSIVLLVSYAAFVAISPWDSHIPIFLGLFLFTFAVYGVAVYFLFRGAGGYGEQSSGNHGDLEKLPSGIWILVPALLFRLLVLWSPPSISEDFYRYLWDGRVQNAGFGPYDYPPQANELASLRDDNYQRINHKEFKTPYPPAAETYFHVVAAISTRPIVFKSCIAIFDILLLEVLRRLLRAEKRDPAWLLLYAWHPLPILEFAGSAHMDILGISLLLLAYLLTRGKRFVLAGISFGCAALIKYLPTVTLPWLWKQGKWKFFLSAVAIVALLFYQFYTADLRMFAGVLSYYKIWRFNDSLFGILYKLLGGAEPARIAGMAFTLIAVGFSFGANFPIYRSAVIIFGTVIIFSPVVHPWYLCWVLPFLVFHPNKAWLFLSGWIVLAYWVRYLYPAGVWKPVLWLSLLIYVPFYFLLVLEAIRSWRRSRFNVQDETVSSDIV